MEQERKKRGRPRVQGEPTSPVALRGGRAYREALSWLAKEKNTTVADMLRVAADEKYGAELASIIPQFEQLASRSTQADTGVATNERA